MPHLTETDIDEIVGRIMDAIATAAPEKFEVSARDLSDEIVAAAQAVSEIRKQLMEFLPDDS
jgi:hypothetical protein